MASRASDLGERPWRWWVDITVAILALGVSVSSLMLSTSGAGGASQTPATLPDSKPVDVQVPTVATMLAAAGVNNAAVHYIFLVDTSVSMGNQDFSDTIRTEVAEFARDRRAGDHASIVAYDVRPWFTWDSRSQDVDVITERLPSFARGSKTDVAAAIEKAVELAKGDPASDIIAMVLLTDGENIPGDNSKYHKTAQTPLPPAWTDLTKAVADLSRERALYAFGYALGAAGQPVRGRFDQLVRQVLPAMVETDAQPIGGLHQRLTQLPKLVRSVRASDVLRASVDSGIALGWPGETPRLAAGANTVTLELSGPGLKVPVQLSEIHVHSDNDRVTIVLEAPAVQVRPQDKVLLRATLTWAPGTSTHLPWRRVTDAYRLGLTAEADLSFLSALDPRMSGRTVRPTIEVSLAGSGSTQLGQPLLWSLAALSALVVLWYVARWARAGMLLSGRLVGVGFDRDGPDSTLLNMRLRRLPWPATKRVRSGETRGRVRAHAVSVKQLRVEYTPDGTSQRRVSRRLTKEAPMMINGVTFHWTAKR